ncbi:MAG: hypothetical protein ABIG56_03265 [Candidatus Omnitrophota bacterium]
MKREKVNIITVPLTISMALIFFLIFISELSAYPSELREPEKTASKQSEEMSVEVIRPEIEYKSQVFTDPFINQVDEEQVIEERREFEESLDLKVKKTPPALQLQGLTWGGRFPQAIIDGQVVKVGDTIQIGTAQDNEIKIVSIDREGVVFSYGGDEFKIDSPAMAAATNKESEGGKDE